MCLILYQAYSLNFSPLAVNTDMTYIISGGIFVAVLVGIFVVLIIKAEIDYRKLIKYANETEKERKRQGKTVDEWYGTEEKKNGNEK